jgi:hypothetical protein
MRWVNERDIPYFGSKIDTRVKQDLARLRLPVLPTEERFDSDGVQGFRELVTKLHASLKLHATMVGETVRYVSLSTNIPLMDNVGWIRTKMMPMPKANLRGRSRRSRSNKV